MPHYHTEGFEGDWKLIRETVSSQKWRVKTDNGLQVEVDIHYTVCKVLTANLVIEGKASKSILNPIMEGIGRLGLYRGDYAVIDYTLDECERLSEGNFSIDEADRKHRRL